MKNIRVFLITLILLASGSFFQQAIAQEKTKAEQEKEVQLQQAIDEQKKAMTDQQKAQDEAAVKMKDQQAKMEKLMKDANVRVESAGKNVDGLRIYAPRGNRSFSYDEAFSGGPGAEGFFGGHYFPGDTERTTWDFSKTVKENSFSRDYTFDVDKTANTVVMSVMGDCKSGDIHIKIIMPNGKSYSDIVIDEFGNLNWRKTFNITDTENQDKTGEWKFQVSANKATGSFRISLQTY